MRVLILSDADANTPAHLTPLLSLMRSCLEDVSVSGDETQAIELLKLQHFDAVFIDATLSFKYCLPVLDFIRNDSSSIRPYSIALTISESDKTFLTLLAAGVSAIIRPPKTISEVQTVVEIIRKGGCYLSMQDTARLIKLTLHNYSDFPLNEDTPLSKTDRRILHFVRQGKTTFQISGLLGFSEISIKKHISNLFENYRAVSRAELIYKSFYDVDSESISNKSSG